MRKILPALLILSAATVEAAPWDQVNNPLKFSRLTGRALTTKLNATPKAAQLKDSTLIWSDTYWPSYRGGISYRWNAEPNPQNFNYRFLSKAEVERMDITQLEKLSPAEKYDIFMGNFNYPFTKKVRSMYKPSNAWWEGICHGWAQAAVMYQEPQRVDLKNRDGLVVPFGATDVKGLLSFYYANVHKTKEYVRVGARCKVAGKVPGEESERDRVPRMPNERDANSKNCAGVNAGALHVVLTNMIGIQSRGFIADVDRFSDVWNQPIHSYSYDIMSERAANAREASAGAAKIVRVKMTMTYGEELNLLDKDPMEEEGGFVSMEPVTNTPAQSFKSKYYEYTLEVDRMGNIIGGEWISETRPDFMWLKGKTSSFGGRGALNMSGLHQIYRPVTN